MEGIIDSKECLTTAKLGMRDDSHAIKKLNPKIRIVHIFAPEVIKTDPANFRELVQRLTGKPTKGKACKAKARPKVKPSCKLIEAMGSRRGYREPREEDGAKKVLEKEEGKLWESSGGFLGGLGDIDGFFQGFTDFPLISLSSSHVDVVGESHVS